MRGMAEKMGSTEGQEVYRVRSKTVEHVFGHIKQNIGLREFLTRGLNEIRAEFTLTCITHNLKRILKIKSQIKDIKANTAENRRFNHTPLKNSCERIKKTWSNLLYSISGSLRHKTIIQIPLKSIVRQPLHCGVDWSLTFKYKYQPWGGTDALQFIAE